MSAETDAFEALRVSELAVGLTEAELWRLAQIARAVEFRPGERMLTEGQLNDRIYVLVSGIADVFRGSGATEERIARVEGGTCVGEMSSLSGKPVSVSVRAQSPVRALAFEGDPLREELGRVPKLGTNLTLVLIERLRRQIGRHGARVCMLAVPDARESWRRAVQALSQAVACHTRRIVVVDLTDEAGHASPSVAELLMEPARLETLEQWLASGVEVPVTVRRGATRPPATQVWAALNVLASRCEALLVVAEEGEALALVTEKPECFARYVSVVSGGGSPLPRLPQIASGAAPACRVLYCDEAPPQAAGAMRTNDARCGALVYSLKAPATARGLAAIARDLAGARVGIALGAGSARGFAHIGVLERLAEIGVPIDALVGSSAGAGIGSLWSFGYEPDRIERLFSDLREHAAAWTLPARSLLNGAKLERYLRHSAGGNGFDDTLWPFGVVAVDLYAGRETLFTSGDLPKCVLASCAIPGIYPPVRLGGRLYVDGGVLHPVPTGFVRPLGVEKVIAVDLAGTESRDEPPESVPYLLEIMRRSTYLMHARISEHSRAAADIVIWPQSPVKPPGVLDYRKARNHWRTLGREAVDRAADDLKRLLPRA